MSEDKTQVQNPVPGAVPHVAKEREALASDLSPDVTGLVEPSHQEFHPPEGLEEHMKPVVTPTHSIEGTGATQHPPSFSTVKGESVVITPPVGIENERAAQSMARGKPNNSLRDAATMFLRQVRRGRKLAKAA